MNDFQKASAVHRGFAARLKELTAEHRKQASLPYARLAGGMASGLGRMANKGFSGIGSRVAGMQPGGMRDLLMGPMHTQALSGMGPHNMQQIGKDVTKRVGAVAGGAYLLDQNGQRRGRNDMADHYNSMGYFPKLMMALTNREAPTQSMFDPMWALPYA